MSRFLEAGAGSSLPGFFISLEGTEGSGKSTVAEHLGRELSAAGSETVVTREPGGTLLGERLRALLLESGSPKVRSETEALLFAASRAEHVAAVIRPALARGAIVVCDRFTDSSLAYQWGGRGLRREVLEAIQRFATGGIEPDLKLLFDLPVAVGLRRREASASSNRFDYETLQFHERVRGAYHALAAADPRRWRVIDASRSEAMVWSDVWDLVSATGIVSSEDDSGVPACVLEPSP